MSTCNIQGDHGTGKTGKIAKKNSLQGKFREFHFAADFRENTGNFASLVAFDKENHRPDAMREIPRTGVF